MRITCVIDNLGSGGAQRQMVMLAVLLKNRGHDVRLVTYYPHDFYKQVLDDSEISVTCAYSRTKIGRIWAVRKTIRTGKPEVVVAYLKIPSILAELSSLPTRDFVLLVSERNVGKNRLSFWLHKLADAIVCNSYAQEAIIRKSCPSLSSRVKTISNCVEIDRYRPKPTYEAERKDTLRILCVGRYAKQKNYLNLLIAVEILAKKRPEINLLIDVYGSKNFVNGNPGPRSNDYLRLQKALKRSIVATCFNLHEAVKDLLEIYQKADALCLPSLWEGCPNVVCEAMACGIPVLASRVGDNPLLVEDGLNGFLFDPTSSEDIANAIHRFYMLPPEDRRAMGQAGRQRAEQYLSPQRFVEQYENLIKTMRLRSAIIGE